MRIEFHGLNFEASRITCTLVTPWRASALEHRLFNDAQKAAGVNVEQGPDEVRMHLADLGQWKNALKQWTRILKGWQEEGSQSGKERRSWRWLLEADTDDHGYDHNKERMSLFLYVRISIDRGDFDDAEPGDMLDLNGFGVRFFLNDKPAQAP